MRQIFRRRWILSFVLLLVGSGAFAQMVLKSSARPVGRPILQIDVHDTLQPERAHIFAEQMKLANPAVNPAVLVHLSTPGGMADSAGEMVDAMRKSPVPVIVWAGAADTRVSGEGLRLLAAADVALVSPRVFLTPLWTDRPRGLTSEAREAGSQALLVHLSADATRHGRSTAMLEGLVSGDHWFTGQEAVRAGLADGIAVTDADVILAAQGRRIVRNGSLIQLNLSGTYMQEIGETPQQRLLDTLMNPDLSVLLLTLGLLLIYLEVNTPGTIVPGAAGLLMVLLAIYALRMLPLNTAGVLACVGAMVLLLLEARLGTHGVLATIGILALVAGLAALVRGPLPQLQVGWGTAMGAGSGFGGVTASLILLGIEARRAKVKTGSDAMLGWLAVAQTPLSPEGQILVRGELWRARLTTNDSSVAAGERVKVLGADGLTLEVTAVPVSQTA